jgi:hypothetical protein
MRRVRVLLILGIWVAVLPFLGFPYSWKDILTALSGLALIYISFVMYRESKVREIGKETFDNFSENHHPRENETSIEQEEQKENGAQGY